MRAGTQLSLAKPQRVPWPWDDRWRGHAVTPESVKRDMRKIADLIRERYDGHVPGVAFRVPACP
jgi:hypothetical protein